MLPQKIVEVTGYPLDLDLQKKGKFGHMFTHSGKIDQVMQTKYGGWIFTYDVDTFKGQSGSAVRITDASFVTENKKLGRFHADKAKTKCILGIHTGSNKDETKNLATLITPEIAEWRDRNLREYEQ